MKENQIIAITGASGFVGQHLISRLTENSFILNIVARSEKHQGRLKNLFPHIKIINLNELPENTRTIVHAAGLAHVTKSNTVRDLEEFTNANVRFLAQVVDEAILKKIKNIINISSVAAISGHSSIGVINDFSKSSPSSTYGVSKLQGEKEVERFAQSGNFGLSLRPPLIIGSNAPANWKKLQRLAASAAPLPFGAIHNRRSYLSVHTLLDFLLHILSNDWSTNKSGSYCISDLTPMSLAEVCTHLRIGMGQTRRLVPFPRQVFLMAGELFGKKQMIESLVGDLVVDPSRLFTTFSFQPKREIISEIEQSGRIFVRPN